MAGIYVHIPFCKTRCIYCGFFSTTLNEWQDRYVEAVIKEYEIAVNKARKDFGTASFDTVYIGGGTPSQLSLPLLEKLLSAFHPSKEYTVECNPDDITPELATLLYNKGVNRVSMGVQTFSPSRLKFLHRRHDASQVYSAIEILRRAGIENISIDLMFGFPEQTLEEWKEDIEKAISLHTEHISAYSLMYEEGTPLYKLLEKGSINELDEETTRSMYYMLIDMLESAGYEQYEISNFARPGYRSQHNSSYWREVPYIGIGSGAHSFDLRSRYWNIEDVKEYIQRVENDTDWIAEREILDAEMRYNDMITTALRTHEGIDLENCNHAKEYIDYLRRQAKPLIEKGLLAIDDHHLHITREGLFVSDDIMSELIYA